MQRIAAQNKVLIQRRYFVAHGVIPPAGDKRPVTQGLHRQSFQLTVTTQWTGGGDDAVARPHKTTSEGDPVTCWTVAPRKHFIVSPGEDWSELEFNMVSAHRGYRENNGGSFGRVQVQQNETLNKREKKSEFHEWLENLSEGCSSQASSTARP